ncbi:MAG: hypothetical protein M1836_002624 [Candelina mexicana]|nr:MAG: hypothetical protein M1836_002624 [Candelina mexicana]
MPEFMDLPKTVREEIYRHSLTNPYGVSHPPSSNSRRRSQTQPQSLITALLLVCKILSREVLQILYGETHFVFMATHELHTFLRGISLQARRFIRVLTFHYIGQKINQTFLLLKQLKQLRKIRIFLEEDLFWSYSSFRPLEFSRLSHRYPSIPQLGLKALLAPGMDTLRELRGLSSVEVIAETEMWAELWGFPGNIIHYRHVISEVLTAELTCPHVNEAGDLGAVEIEIFRFLSLPPELRQNIYILHMSVEGPIIPMNAIPTSGYHCAIAGRHDPRRKPGPVPPSRLALLQVSRQIYNEALTYFYSRNQMWLTSEVHLCHFLDGIGPDRAQYLTSIAFWWGVRGYSRSMGVPEFDRLATLKRLRKFQLVFDNITDCENVAKCNIGDLPGMDMLRSIRGLSELTVKDIYPNDWEDSSSYMGSETDEPPTINEIKRSQLEEDLRSVMLLPREEVKAEAT